jgi:alcohol dehydrogenase YqhD (iron-dependent ADH family)
MRKLICITFILAMSGLAGCVSDADRAAAADADFKEQRLDILKKYGQCVDQAKPDEAKLKACEHYLKAIDAMK